MSAEAAEIVNDHDSSRRRLPSDYLVYSVIALAVLVTSAFFCRHAVFWYNEVCGMGIISRPHLADVLQPGLSMSDPIPLVYQTFIWLWNKLLIAVIGVPFAAWWLMLPSFFFAAGTVFITGVIARRLIGPGFVTWVVCAICATSATWLSVAVQMRYEGLLFLFSAVTVYFYVLLSQDRSGEGRHRWALRVALGVSMALAVLTGYSAIFWLVTLFIIDIYRLIRRQMVIKDFLSYVIGAVLCLPWAAAVVITILRQGLDRSALTQLWPDKPSAGLVASIYTTMTGSYAVVALYVLAIVLLIVSWVASRRAKVGIDPGASTLQWTMILSPALMILLIVFYSTVLVPAGSLLVMRYFYLTWPMLCLTMGQALSVIEKTWKPLRNPRVRATAIVLVVVLVMLQTLWFLRAYRATPHYIKHTMTPPYAATALFLSQQSDLSDGTAAVYMGGRDLLVEGFDYYYVTKQGTQPGFTIWQTIPEGYDTLYIFHPTVMIWKPTATFLKSYVLQSTQKQPHLDIYVKVDAP